MVRIYVWCAIFLGLWGCGDTSQPPLEAYTGNEGLQDLELPHKVSLNSSARELVNEWPEYLSLETSLDGFDRVENREDLSLLVEEILEKEKAISASNYPPRFDKPQVKSRQKVFRTQLLKVKAHLEYRTEAMPALNEMMEAYNAMCTQLNVIVNNNLDTELLSDE